MNFKIFMTKVNPINHPARPVLPVPRHRNGRINWEVIRPGTRLRWAPTDGYSVYDACDVEFIRAETEYIRVCCVERSHPIWPYNHTLVCLRSELRAI